VRSMGMLGNSTRGLLPMQKRLLYRSCVVPVMTYGLCLWYFKGAHVKGTIKALAQVQSMALHWISGCFRTTPIGGMESLMGLLPMHAPPPSTLGREERPSGISLGPLPPPQDYPGGLPAGVSASTRVGVGSYRATICCITVEPLGGLSDCVRINHTG
jgi:hypothetical protein